MFKRALERRQISGTPRAPVRALRAWDSGAAIEPGDEQMLPLLRRHLPSMSHDLRAQVEVLTEEEDRTAEIGAGVVRIVAGLVLLAVGVATTATVGRSEQIASIHHYWAGALVIGGFVLSGLAGVGLARSRFYRRQLAFAFLALDAGLVGLFLHLNFESTGLSGDFAASLPVVWLVPLFLAGAALRMRPDVQVFALIAFGLVLVSIVLAHGTIDLDSRRAVVGETARFFAPQPNIMRLAMLLLAGALLVVAAYRGRNLLLHALGEAERQAALTKFLPAEIASLVTDASPAALRHGRRQPAAILFIDMRDSTARAENMDPVQLSIFISAFRRRVMRAAEQHEGVIDKFIGDGALIVFGLPEARPDDAARALACARTLLHLIARWNEKRRFDPPVRVGIGVHAGEVFFGVIGDDSRKELTVLGDAVNVGARLEEATKRFGTPLLASAEAVEAAGESSGWIELRSDPLRGRTGQIRVMQPA
jgi:adenylate cyclase